MKLSKKYHERLLNNIELRNKFIVKNMPLVLTVYKKMHCNKLTKNDAIQAGAIGLMTALEKYDPNKDISFSTYAWYWILNSIQREEYKYYHIIMPVHAIEKQKAMFKVFEETFSNTTSNIKNFDIETVLESIRSTMRNASLDQLRIIWKGILNTTVSYDEHPLVSTYQIDYEQFNTFEKDLENHLLTYPSLPRYLIRCHLNLDNLPKRLSRRAISEHMACTHQNLSRIHNVYIKKLRRWCNRYLSRRTHGKAQYRE